MKKSIAACMGLLLATASVGKAQGDRSAEYSVWAGGGLSALSYKGGADLGFGAFGGAGYTTFLNPNVGFKFGLEVMSFSGQLNKIDSLETRYAIGESGDSSFRVTFRGFEESQKALYLNVPVMVHFRRGMFSASLGAKLGLKLNSTFSNSGDSITAGTYDGDALYGSLFCAQNTKATGSLSLGINVAASAELGVVWPVSRRLNLYTGVYADYGLMNLTSVYAPAMTLTTTPPTENTFKQSMLETRKEITRQGASSNVVDRVSTLTVGVKIGVIIPAKSSSKSRPAEMPENAYVESSEDSPTPTPEASESVVEQTSVGEDGTALSEETPAEQSKAAQKQAELAEKERIAKEKKAAKEKAKLSPREQAMEENMEQIREMQASLAVQTEAVVEAQKATAQAVVAAQSAAEAAQAAAQAALSAVEAIQQDKQGKQAKAQATDKQAAADKPTAVKPREKASSKRASASGANRGLVYKVQVSARRAPLADVESEFARYALTHQVEEERYGNSTSEYTYKYVTGAFTLLEDATNELQKIRRGGIGDAFLVAYYNGGRINIVEAGEIAAKMKEQENKKKNEGNKGKVKEVKEVREE